VPSFGLLFSRVFRTGEATSRQKSSAVLSERSSSWSPLKAVPQVTLTPFADRLGLSEKLPADRVIVQPSGRQEEPSLLQWGSSFQVGGTCFHSEEDAKKQNREVVIVSERESTELHRASRGFFIFLFFFFSGWNPFTLLTDGIISVGVGYFLSLLIFVVVPLLNSPIRSF